MKEHSKEVSEGQRFEFGKNWQRFLQVLNDTRVEEAEDSLREMLGLDNLEGKKFLDMGSGSGLFSLAAKGLGAEVHSFDYDPQAVACTEELKRRYYQNDKNWVIEEGSALDEEYVKSLGHFDVVYSWGVLHHTGNMWKALHNAHIPVADGGSLFVALYNDRGIISKFWTAIKKTYCSGQYGKIITTGIFIPYFFFGTFATDLTRFQNPIRRYYECLDGNRGMSIYYDWIDWLGGYPFEVATLEEVVNFYQKYHFIPQKIEKGRRNNCNQFVFKKEKS